MLFSNFLTFDWNAASESDWKYIERNFIAAYFNAYKDCDLAQLSISPSILREAQEIWDRAYSQACKGNAQALALDIFNPLAPLLSHVNSMVTPAKDPLSDQKEALNVHFAKKSTDIIATKEYLIKLTALRHYFEEEYEGERNKILKQDKGTNQRIHYLVARFEDRPIAFVSCELNYKSGRIYMRWVTMSPSFQRQGLGGMMFEEVRKHFPENTGIELYTRVANHPARSFYTKLGFKDTTKFDFSEPKPGYFATYVSKWLSKDTDTKCCAPEDEAVSKTEDFIGFIKKQHTHPLISEDDCLSKKKTGMKY